MRASRSRRRRLDPLPNPLPATRGEGTGSSPRRGTSRRRTRATAANEPASALWAGVPSSDGSIAAGAGMPTVQAALSAATRAALSSTRARTSLRASAAWTIASNAALLARDRLAHQQVIAAGLDRADRQLLDRIAVGDRLHAEIVGHQHAAKAELAAQQVGRDPARQRRRPIGIERRVQHVRGHERLHARRRPPPRTAPAPPRAAARRRARRPAARGASRSACRRGRDSACRSRPAPRRAARARTPAPGGRPRRACVPNARLPITGFAGLVCTSSTGAKFQPTPTAASSSPSARPTAVVRADVARRPDRQHRRPDGRRRAQPLHQSPLLVDRNEQRRSRPGPPPAAPPPAPPPGPASTMFGPKQHDAADLRRGDARAQLVARGRPLESDGQELPSEACESGHSRAPPRQPGRRRSGQPGRARVRS